MSEQLSEADFVDKVEQAIAVLEQSFADLADDREIDVEVEGGVLTVTFEEGEPGKFIVSPNSSVRQIWVSARVSSFKFNWSEEAGQFLLAGTGEPLKEVMTRLTRDQLGDPGVSL
ncbi:MAG TPA: iron donor protein CyaY [Blastocatellia bacterium]|nr:iron donor protein CyaY [Blastocatellia bacterium]